MDRIDPLRNFRYRLEIANLTQAGFCEVTMAESTIDAIDYREGTDPPHVRKLSGLTKHGNITLKRGVTFGGNALELFNWYKNISAGKILEFRQNVSIVVQDESGEDGPRFLISEAWPLKYDPTDLNATGNEVFIELLELANEGVERTA